jgi:hypothetical protein
MAWSSTRDAPPATWPWREEYEIGAKVAIPIDERAAIAIINDVLLKYDATGLHGQHVVDLGCGRGACLAEARAHGASELLGVDPDLWACKLTERNVDGAKTICGDATAALEAGVRAGIVWSHGVVEHLEGDELFDHLWCAIEMSRRWVAFSAPNPANGPYRDFRENHLLNETWPFGFEEPLLSYGQMLLDMGCRTVWDGSVGDHIFHLALLYAQALPRVRQVYWTNEFIEQGRIPGPITLVVAAVPGAL